MSFEDISTSFINELVNNARFENKTKTSDKFKFNGHDCEVNSKKGVNLLDICAVFGIQLKRVKEWKSKNATFLQKYYGEIVKPKTKNNKSTETQPELQSERRKAIIDAGCNYIDPRFVIQCLMGSSIEFNNWVTNIVLGSLI